MCLISLISLKFLNSQQKTKIVIQVPIKHQTRVVRNSASLHLDQYALITTSSVVRTVNLLERVKFVILALESIVTSSSKFSDEEQNIYVLTLNYIKFSETEKLKFRKVRKFWGPSFK